ncbi:MAG: hypothetical protein LBJ89_03295 [Holosporales bacterium]|jgi:hypothetical protein|nr:hypothetical protein [Holosporales bacterium]
MDVSSCKAIVFSCIITSMVEPLICATNMMDAAGDVVEKAYRLAAKTSVIIEEVTAPAMPLYMRWLSACDRVVTSAYAQAWYLTLEAANTSWRVAGELYYITTNAGDRFGETIVPIAREKTRAIGEQALEAVNDGWEVVCYVTTETGRIIGEIVSPMVPPVLGIAKSIGDQTLVTVKDGWEIVSDIATETNRKACGVILPMMHILQARAIDIEEQALYAINGGWNIIVKTSEATADTGQKVGEIIIRMGPPTVDMVVAVGRAVGHAGQETLHTVKKLPSTCSQMRSATGIFVSNLKSYTKGLWPLIVKYTP